MPAVTGRGLVHCPLVYCSCLLSLYGPYVWNQNNVNFLEDKSSDSPPHAAENVRLSRLAPPEHVRLSFLPGERLGDA